MKVLVTGASRGIGKSISKLFFDKGHDVYAPSRQELDLSSDIKLKDVNFDIVINNAGINMLSEVENITDDLVMKTNYFSPLKITQLCLPYMKSNCYGRIVNIGSVWIEQTKTLRHAYSASKSALHELTKSLTSEFSKYNILANTVSPGFILTDMTKQNNNAEQIQKLAHQTPVNRLGTTEEVANLVYFLTVENSFITGQNIIIDGGFSCTRI